MAREITVWRTERGSGRRIRVFIAIFVYSFPPIVINGQVVIPTPSTHLDREILDLNLLDAAQIAGLDGGTHAFEIIPVHRLPGETMADVTTRAEALYQKKRTAFLTDLQLKYAQSGMTLNVV